MATTTYKITRAIDKPIEFRGLKAHYILYAGVVFVADFFLFAILYLFNLSSWICIAVSFGLGGTVISMIYRRSRLYGEYGLAKKRAAKRIPSSLTNNSISTFTGLKLSKCKKN